ncbi:hypothetical protein [Brevibacterium senegalense]|uniref:hypothetical protein n=1 Tax=Brevibacterium senegalense TaxID=1033736 RepID=UPI000371FEEF|nr:hypothetical protein [Brevibacterium senegalense]
MSSPQHSAPPARPRIRKAHSDEHEYSAPSAPSHSAAHDRSTYYEYIARHGDENRATGASAPHVGEAYSGGAPNSSGPHHSAPHSYAPHASGPHGAGGIGSPPHAGAPPVGTPHGGAAHSGSPHGPTAPGSPVAFGSPGAPASSSAPGAPVSFRLRGLLAGVVVLAVVVAVTIVLGAVFLGPDRGMQATDARSSAPSAGAGEASPDTASEATAGEQLTAEVDEGTRIAQDRLAEQWVVQLSAKKPGLEADGKTWAEEDILAEYTENQRRHPEAILLWSGDWTSFRLSDFWVTVLAEPYDTPEEALETCRDLGLDRDNCFAKKLSTSEGPDGTTLLND